MGHCKLLYVMRGDPYRTAAEVPPYEEPAKITKLVDNHYSDLKRCEENSIKEFLNILCYKYELINCAVHYSNKFDAWELIFKAEEWPTANYLGVLIIDRQIILFNSIYASMTIEKMVRKASNTYRKEMLACTYGYKKNNR